MNPKRDNKRKRAALELVRAAARIVGNAKILDRALKELESPRDKREMNRG